MINWKEYHEQMAKGYRNVANEYRKTAQAVAESDPNLAGFSLMRAEVNEAFAAEEDFKAKQNQN